jgi:20S proteasome alpha/beta subunit
MKNNDISIGTGAIYRYDAVGSFERVRAACVGKGEKLIQPLLDELSQMDADLALWKDLNHVPKQLGDEEHSNSALLTSSVTTVSVKYIDISVEAACDLVLKGFMAAAEREISVGDGVEIVILYKNENDIRLDTDQINSKSSFVVKKVADYRRQKYVMENRNYVLPHH